MVRKSVIIGGIVVIAVLGLGTFLFLNSTVPLERKDETLNDTFSVAGHTYENRTLWIDSLGKYAASFAVSEGTIKSTLMVGLEFTLWLEGKVQPQWIESNQADYGRDMAYKDVTMYFVFWNNGNVTKQVHLQVSKVCEETNYVGLLGGGALILTGITMGVILAHVQKNLWKIRG